MKILFIAHRIPYPPNKGEKIRAYNIIKYLANRHEIYVAALVDSRRDLTYAKNVHIPCKRFEYAYINSGLKKPLCLRAFFKKRPISACYFYERRLQRTVDSIIEREDPDVIFCSSSPTAEYVFRSKALKESPKVPLLLMDLIDVDSKKWSEYAKKTGFPLNLIYDLESRFLGEYEKKVLECFQHVFLTSMCEAKLLEDGPYPNLHVMGNGVDVAFFNPAYIPSIKRSRGPVLVFTGAMDYYPNVDGVLWFANTVYPRIKERFKDCTFFIVGGNPAPSIRALHGKLGIHVTGFVDDVRDYLAIADLCVAPLRIARGIQNKVLEAMAMGKPVVATPESAEGIEAIRGEELVVAGDEGAFLNSVVRLLTHQDEAKKMGERARVRIESDYSWENRLSVLDVLLTFAPNCVHYAAPIDLY